MQRALFRPIPDLDQIALPAAREERLQAILKNVETHQQEVRASLLSNAQQELFTPGSTDATSPTSPVENESTSKHELFNQNVNALHGEGAPDPVLSHGTIVSTDSSVKQAVVPSAIQTALEAVQQVDAYDKHARRVRDFYSKALERERGAR
ncbi:hypothetical protein LTR62_004694 [Meristemomyces frigidus]|uniref:Uncharacterized protein n=1 Tax=Meristemomyces frigidus TaxID=1508187 RepID=A0AAN7TEA7_9PEZI|nr:hypothetical protein LTR62_004694 [Meristemomyces frigidus]